MHIPILPCDRPNLRSTAFCWRPDSRPGDPIVLSRPGDCGRRYIICRNGAGGLMVREMVKAGCYHTLFTASPAEWAALFHDLGIQLE